MDFKSHIERHRKLLGWSRRRLSIAIQMEASYIGKVEDGLIDPSLRVLRAMAKIFREHEAAFDPSVEQLLGMPTSDPSLQPAQVA